MNEVLLNENDEAIMKSALEPVLANFLIPPNHDLYHYTNGDGFLGIVKDQKLLATHISCLNDTSEILYAIEKFREKLKLRMQGPLDAKIRHLLNSPEFSRHPLSLLSSVFRIRRVTASRF